MEILTLLDPSTVDPTASHSTDNSGLTPALVSAAMAGTNPIGMSLLMRRVCGTVEADTGILRLQLIVIREAKRLKWKYERSDTLKLLTDLCIWEYTNSAICGKCDGSGVIVHEDQVTRSECRKCKGSGYAQNGATLRSNWLDVSRNTYYKTWEKRRAHISELFNEMLPEYEYAAGKHIKYRLRRVVESGT